MENELKNDLIASWNESEELLTSFLELSNEDIIENKQSLIDRVEKIQHWIGKYVTENDIIQTL